MYVCTRTPVHITQRKQSSSLNIFQTRDTQSTEDRKKVTDLLCHSTAVSDIFYARNPSEEEARRVRGIIDAALEEVECVDSLPEGPSADDEKRTQEERQRWQLCSRSHVLLPRLKLPLSPLQRSGARIQQKVIQPRTKGAPKRRKRRGGKDTE